VKKCVLVAILAATAAAAACTVLATPAQAARTQPLAQGPVMVPPGEWFLSIGYLPQPAGSSFGPHGHVPGLVYALSDHVTTVGNDSTTALKKGEGHFVPALAVHTHENSDNRLPAGTLAVGLVLAVVILLLSARVSSARVVLVPALLAAIIAGSAVALWNPWKNEWFFLGMRPEVARGAPMPLPSASRTYESPEFSNVAPGRYVESLATTTVDPRGQVAGSTAPGPVVFLVLDGRAEVTVGNATPIRLGHHQATLVQAGESFRVLNPSGTTLRLLRFALTPERSSS
jgi:quercetin dioxygenase-like cupin family protein